MNMIKVDVQKEIKKVVKKIVKEYKPEKIILFGSYAWGKPTKDSDIDLFILKESNKPRRERQIKMRSFLFGIRFPYDILIYTQKEVTNRMDIGDFFIRDILTKGNILYEK